jgi:uncharacterized protein YqjF (DUF2071 family)
MVVPLSLAMRDVLFAGWSLDRSVVEAHLPDRLTADAFDDEAWLTAVALVNVDARPRGAPSAFGVRLPEVNLHAPVTCDGVPGIYYFGVEVAGLLGTVFPRLFHHAPYHYADVDLRSAGDRTRVTCGRRSPGSRPARFDATYGPGDDVEAGPGSLARFLTDRHRFFTQRQDGTLCSAALRHAPWPLRRADATIRRNTLFRANGFADPSDGPVCYHSPGVEADVSRCLPWRGGTG